MDDFGSIIYLIITIIAIVFSIYKKGKATPNKPTSDGGADPFGDMIPSFEKMFQQEEPTTKEFIPEPVEITKQAKTSKSDFEEKMKQMESKMSRIPRIKPINVEHDTDVITNMEWFNARDAIIYSEILKRPEY